MNKAIVLIALSFSLSKMVVAQKETAYYKNIVGTWIERGSENEDDKWIFRADKTVEVYSNGELFTKYDKYEIVRTSDECGHATFNEEIYILKMEENTITSKHDYKIENVGPIIYDCFYINGIEDELMSISYFNRGGPPLVLLRQTEPAPRKN